MLYLAAWCFCPAGCCGSHATPAQWSDRPFPTAAPVDRSASLLRGCARSPCHRPARRSLRRTTGRKYARALPRLRTSRVIRGRDFRPAGIRRQLRRTADDASQLFSTASGLGQLGNLMLQIGGHGLPCSSRLSLCVSRLATHARREILPRASAQVVL
jgi:hypothetical protein